MSGVTVPVYRPGWRASNDPVPTDRSTTTRAASGNRLACRPDPPSRPGALLGQLPMVIVS